MGGGERAGRLASFAATSTTFTCAVFTGVRLRFHRQRDRTIRQWDVTTGKEVRQFTGHADGVSSLAISRDGRRLLSGSWDKSVRLWDVDTGKELKRFEEGHSQQVWGVALSPDGKRALSASFDLTVRLWDVNLGKELQSFKGHTQSIWVVAFSPDGKQALSAGRPRAAPVDAASAEMIRV